MGKVAFVFPGQGAQYVGMCKDFADAYEVVDVYFKTAELFLPGITKMLFCGPKEALDQTINTQPAMLIADVLCAELLSCNGIEPDGVAGFSLGEMAALFFSGSLTLENACAITKLRANLMGVCASEQAGAMYAALRLPPSIVDEICQSIPQCWPANYNCPGQIVISCAEVSADELKRAITEHGGRAIKLSVQGAFHSPMMQGAIGDYAAALGLIKFDEPDYPVYSNVTAKPHNIKNITETLVKHMIGPVLWQNTIENMIADGFDTFIECGPGKVLAGLIKKIDPMVNVYNVYDMESLTETLAAFDLPCDDTPFIERLYHGEFDEEFYALPGSSCDGLHVENDGDHRYGGEARV
ncbi:MAG: ACP S-malonyltransferase [Clostridiales bacterium]|jgi:[acyl-carrier-protein] S-malonyltransferase|nr:ACP S-malonyltransferase [Clostridiales bacterium]